MKTKTLHRKSSWKGVVAAAALGVALLMGVCASPSSAYAANSGKELTAGAVTTESNGVINKVSQDPSDNSEIYFYNENAIDPNQMESQYEDECSAAVSDVWKKYDAGKITYEEAEAQESKLNATCRAKANAYKAKVSRSVYDGWNIDTYIADRNRIRKDDGYAPLTAAQISKLKAGSGSEYIDLGDGSYEYGWADTIKSHTVQAVNGVTYNLASNTLTIKNLKTTDILRVMNAGNDFKIKVVGTNEIGMIDVWDNGNASVYDSKKGYYVSVNKTANWGAGVAFSGTGSLYVNKNKTNTSGISVSTYNTAGSVIVGKNVSLRVRSKGDASAIVVTGTNAKAWKNAIQMKGIDGNPQVKWSTENIAYPLYQPAYAYSAEDAKDGVLAINPNDGDYGWDNLLCSDKKHIAWVTQTHKDAKSGKYVIDQWMVQPVTLSYWDDGSYDYTTTGDAVRVPSVNGQPKGYSLIKVSDHAATNTYSVADTDIAQLGKTIVLGKATYTAKYNKAKKAAEVSLKKAPNAKTVVVGKTISVNGKKYSVTGIGKKAFKKAKRCTTVKVKTTKLTKSSVKNCFKGAKKVATVKVPKRVKAAYSEYFAKGNSGKEVTVK
jgi:sorbitol-specific phosphotransferase system component IIA